MNIIGYIEGILGYVTNAVGEGILYTLKNIENLASTYVFQPISQDISGVLNGVSNSLNYLEASASSSLTDVVNSVGNTLAHVETQVSNAATSAVSAVASSLSSIGDAIASDIDKIATGIENGFTAI